MRLVQRQSPSPLHYATAFLGSLATVILIVFALTGDLAVTARALATVDAGYLFRVFVVIGVVSLSGVVSYRAGLWNIGQEGQAIVGALAAISADNAAEAVMSVALAAAGWTLIPAALRVAPGVNEAVTTFLMSLAAVSAARYFVEGPLKDPAKKGFIATVEAPYMEPALAAALFAGVLAGVVLLYRTRVGLTMRLLSSGEEVVRYTGKQPKLYIAATLGLSGILAGIGGAVEIMTREAGRYMTLQQVSTGFGLYGISAAWLGGLHPLGATAASLYIAWLYQVAVNLKVAGLPALVANALVGTAMAWGLAGYVMYKYKVVWR
jgi:simple sugar transport system permease protein